MSARKRAKELGHTTYHGEPHHCGTTEKYTSKGSCVYCTKKNVKERVEDGYFSRHYKSNRERILAAGREYKKKNPERSAERSAEWARKNPERVREIKRAYKYRRRAQEGAGMSAAEMNRWRKSAKKVCYWCGVKCEQGYTVDHYEPLAKGGKHEADNLVIACRSCNCRKSCKDPLEFAAQVGRLF